MIRPAQHVLLGQGRAAEPEPGPIVSPFTLFTEFLDGGFSFTPDQVGQGGRAISGDGSATTVYPASDDVYRIISVSPGGAISVQPETSYPVSQYGRPRLHLSSVNWAYSRTTNQRIVLPDGSYSQNLPGSFSPYPNVFELDSALLCASSDRIYIAQSDYSEWSIFADISDLFGATIDGSLGVGVDANNGRILCFFQDSAGLSHIAGFSLSAEILFHCEVVLSGDYSDIAEFDFIFPLQNNGVLLIEERGTTVNSYGILVVDIGSETQELNAIITDDAKIPRSAHDGTTYMAHPTKNILYMLAFYTNGIRRSAISFDESITEFGSWADAIQGVND
jgi:hypothetical protein